MRTRKEPHLFSQRLQCTVLATLFVALTATPQISHGKDKVPDCTNVGEIAVWNGTTWVCSATVPPNSVGTTEIKPFSVTASDLNSNSVDSSKVIDNSLTANDLAADSVGGIELQNNSVNSAKVTNNSIQDIDILNEAGVDFASGNQLTSLPLTTPPSAITIRSTFITAPTSGFVIVYVSGFFELREAVTTDRDSVLCSISTGFSPVIDSAHSIAAFETLPTSEIFGVIPFAGTRVFQVPAGTTKFNLDCQLFDGEVSVGDSTITALFVPTRY